MRVGERSGALKEDGRECSDQPVVQHSEALTLTPACLLCSVGRREDGAPSWWWPVCEAVLASRSVAERSIGESRAVLECIVFTTA